MEDIVQKILDALKDDKYYIEITSEWLEEKKIREFVNQKIKALIDEENILTSDIIVKAGGENTLFIIGNQVLKISKRPEKEFRTIPKHPLILEPKSEEQLPSSDEGKVYRIQLFEKVNIPPLITLEDSFSVQKELLKDNIFFGDARPINLGKKPGTDNWIIIDADHVSYLDEHIEEQKKENRNYDFNEDMKLFIKLVELVKESYDIAKKNNNEKDLTQAEYWKLVSEAMDKVIEEQNKKITPEVAVKSALKGTSATKADEANCVEKTELNPENIKEGETKYD